jgi:hypothetical protein
VEGPSSRPLPAFRDSYPFDGRGLGQLDHSEALTSVVTVSKPSKTKSGAVMTIEVEARDQKDAEEKVKRENPTCTIMRVVTRV